MAGGLGARGAGAAGYFDAAPAGDGSERGARAGDARVRRDERARGRVPRGAAGREPLSGRALGGLVKPTSGRVFFDGLPVEGPGPERAVVFQDAALFPWLTLEKNIAFPLEVAGVPRRERGARVEELLRLVHLSRFRGSYPHEL